MAPAKHVLCVGAAVLDTIFRVTHLPNGEGKVLPYEMLQIAEGMASSAAYAIARLGGRPSLWGSVGDDPSGDRVRQELGACGIDVTGLASVPGARSAVATILVDDKGERLIVPFYDPALHAVRRYVTDDEIAAFDAVLVDVRWPDLAADVLAAARRVGIPAILDGDVAPVGVLRRLVLLADHIVFSQPAAMALTGLRQPRAMISELGGELPHAFLCVTVGALGSYWREPRSVDLHYQPGLPVTAVDTLAAGDAFHGAFALGMAEGMDFGEAVRLASVTAALKCQVFGGRTGMPTRGEAMDALLRLAQATTVSA